MLFEQFWKWLKMKFNLRKLEPMLIDKSREKLLNVIIYFANNTVYCGKTKLYKLLYFLDFQHYQEIGKSVTSLKYFAWKMGPVPVRLEDLFQFPDTFKDYLEIETIRINKGEMVNFKPKKNFNERIFSRREIKILESLVKKHRNDLAENMIEATHLENLPWHKVYEIEKRKQALIPYSYALKKSEKETMEWLIKEREEVEENYK